MSNTIGEDLDRELYKLNAKIDLLADYLDLEFEENWDEVISVRRRRQDEE